MAHKQDITGIRQATKELSKPIGQYLRYRPTNHNPAPYPHSWLFVTCDSDSTVAIQNAQQSALNTYRSPSTPDRPKGLIEAYQSTLDAKTLEYRNKLMRIGHIAGALSKGDNDIVTRAIEYRLNHLIPDKRSLPRKRVRPSPSKARKARYMRRMYRSGYRPSRPVQRDSWAQVHSMCVQASTLSSKERKWYRSRLRVMCAHDSTLDWIEVLAHFQSLRRDNTCNVVSQYSTD